MVLHLVEMLMGLFALSSFLHTRKVLHFRFLLQRSFPNHASIANHILLQILDEDATRTTHSQKLRSLVTRNAGISRDTPMLALPTRSANFLKFTTQEA